MVSRVLVGCLSLACLVAAGPAAAQTAGIGASPVRSALAPIPFVDLPSPSPAGGSDPIWEGLLIGGGIGTVMGMVIVPPWFCGHNDSECTAIVRVAVGLPIAAGGFVAGALIDKYTQRGPFVWRSRSGRRVGRLDPRVGPTGAAVRVTVRFR
jgi:hypothetical protein